MCLEIQCIKLKGVASSIMGADRKWVKQNPNNTQRKLIAVQIRENRKQLAVAFY